MEVSQKTYICCYWKIYNMKELIVRAISGVLYISIIVFAMFSSREWLTGLFLILALITLNEFLRVLSFKGFIPYLLLVVGFYFLGFLPTNDLVIHVFLAASVLVNLWLLIKLFSTTNSTPSLAEKYLYSFFYITAGFIFLTRIPFTNLDAKPGIIISIFVLIWANDTFAYLVGKSIGKHKLMERVSPKKTIEGFFGGMVGAIIASFIIFKYTSLFSAPIWIAMALLISVIGTAGDLIQSKFKRLAGVKDSGKLMPGHGGLYDRLDSIIYVAPFVYLFIQVLYYVS